MELNHEGKYDDTITANTELNLVEECKDKNGNVYIRKLCVAISRLMQSRTMLAQIHFVRRSAGRICKKNLSTFGTDVFYN